MTITLTPQEQDMTNSARSSAALFIVSSNDVERSSRRGQLSVVTAAGALSANTPVDTNIVSTDTSAPPAPRRSLLATVGRFLAPKAPIKTGERVNADFWDQRHMS